MNRRRISAQEFWDVWTIDRRRAGCPTRWHRPRRRGDRRQIDHRRAWEAVAAENVDRRMSALDQRSALGLSPGLLPLLIVEGMRPL
jgi:hypothetical protein